MVTMWTGILPELPIADVLSDIAAAGFTGAEFSVNHDKALLNEASDPIARAYDIGALARDLRVPFEQMHAPMVNVCSAQQPEAEQILMASIERAAAMGVKWLVIHPGHDPAACSSRRIEQMVRETNVRVLTNLLELADQRDIGIAVENMTTYSATPAPRRMELRFGQSVGDLLWLIEKIGSPRLGVCWDTGHAQTQQIDQEIALGELGSHVKALHLSDNDGTADSHWMPLRGTILWQNVFRALRKINYCGPTNFEIVRERCFPPAQRRHVLALARELAEHLWSLAEPTAVSPSVSA